MTNDQLRKLAEICGRVTAIVDDKIYYNEDINEPRHKCTKWQPHIDCNQFEEVLFAVVTELDINLRYGYDGVKVNIRKPYPPNCLLYTSPSPRD